MGLRKCLALVNIIVFLLVSFAMLRNWTDLKAEVAWWLVSKFCAVSNPSSVYLLCKPRGNRGTIQFASKDTLFAEEAGELVAEMEHSLFLLKKLLKP